MNKKFIQTKGNQSVITIPRGSDFWKKPIELKREDFQKNLTVSVGAYAKVTLIEMLEKKGEETLELHRLLKAGKGSQVRWITIQTLSDTVSLKESRESEIDEGAKVRFFACHLGGKEVASSLLHHAQGAKAQCDTDLLARTKNNQSFQFTLKNTYSEKNGQGVIDAKGVAEDESSLGMRGVIKIEQAGGGTDCHLNQGVLNLSPKAKVKATPALEIDTNDVKAAHSASITNLNEEALFYLESRGIEKEAAKKLLVHGFLKEMIDELKDLPEVQNKIIKLL